MDKPKATPKDFFLWAGAMVTLYASIISFLSLIFQYIEQVFPDTELNYYYDPYQSGVAYAMASLIVLAPTFLILMRVIRRSIVADPSRGEVWVRRWALFLTVFLAGATIVIDLIVLLTSFLSGEELTMAFLLKVVVVLLVAAAGFMHFLADIWGYWMQNPQYARYVNYATGALVALSIVAGFLIIGTPQSQRQLRLDHQRVSDLQSIQSQVVEYWRQKGSLPASFEELRDPLYGSYIPVDPATKAAYGYKRRSPLDFTLCATFATELRSGRLSVPTRPVLYGIDDTWEHGAGEVCFDRSIDPTRYPPYPKTY